MSMTVALERVQLQNNAARLRIQGFNYAEIAEQLSCTPGEAYSAVMAVLKDETITKESRSEELRLIMTARLERAINAINPEVEAGNLYAIDRFIKIQQQIGEFNGVKVEHHDITSGGKPIQAMSSENIMKLMEMAQAELQNWEQQAMLPPPTVVPDENVVST